MRLAFTGQARHTDFRDGYSLYTRRSRNGCCVSEPEYRRIVRAYCGILADRLVNEGMIDLPGTLGSVAAVTITRKPQYIGERFVGYGKMDWEKGHRDGNLKAFGITFLPRRGKNNNLRCYGFVANRRLFKRVKGKFVSGDCGWVPLEFNDDMV